jgi:hypothetical protein
MTINGSNFQNGATLTFRDPAGNLITSTASKLSFISSSRIDYQFNNAGAVGNWQVRVNNPDGQSSGYFTFTVKDGSTNPTATEIVNQIRIFAQQYKIPDVIIAAVMSQESPGWKQFDEGTGKAVIGPTGDVGLMQINVITPALSFDIQRVYTDWVYNLEIGCRILQQKFLKYAKDTSSPYDSYYDTEADIIENWYYPVAWYNGLGTDAYNYVKNVWNYLLNPPFPANNFFSGVALLGNPQRLSDFPSTIYDAIPWPKGSLDLATATPQQLISHGMYSLLILAQNGQRVHRWRWDNSTVEDITNQFDTSTQQIDQAQLIAETYPDGTVLSPQQTFTKTWTIKNTGKTTWNNNYGIVYVNGNLSTNHSKVSITGTIVPGQSFTFSLPMISPTADGIYREDWKLVNGAGSTIPVGGSQTIWTSIKVVSGVPQTLAINVSPSNVQTLDWGQSAFYTIIVKDQNGNPVAGAKVVGQDEIGGRSYQTSVTNFDGSVTYQTGTIPQNIQNGAIYNITFKAIKSGFIDSPILTRQVQVNHLKTPLPFISLSPNTHLKFVAQYNGTLPNSQTLTITNTGGGTLNWSISGIPSWLNVTPSSNVNNITNVQIQPNSVNLNPQNSPYIASLQITSGNASNTPQTLDIIYQIEGNVNQLTFGALTVYANSITDVSSDTKRASGNV